MQTLKDRDPQEFEKLVGLYNLAIEQVSASDYERAAPPPQDKRPFFLIDAWGLECFKIGFEIGSQLAQNE